MKKKCKSCEKELLIGFFNEQSGDDCVMCANYRVELKPVEKSTDFEVVDDKGCAGGGCTL